MKAITLLLLISAGFICLQQPIVMDAKRSWMRIEGTSSIHDWHSEVENFTIRGTISRQEITDLNLEVKAKYIKSGKSLMDEKTYDALKADKHPIITFSAPKLAINDSTVQGEGSLSIAGTTKPTAIKAIIKREVKGACVTGTVTLKMSDFRIDPPTAVFGSITTGDEIRIRYSITFTQ